MFSFFRRKKTTLVDQFVNTVYGDISREKTADLDTAVALAADELLGGNFDREQLAAIAKQLNDGPLPYSTHDLAVSVALWALKAVSPSDQSALFETQLKARLSVLDWLKEGKVVPALAAAFEHTLYEKFKPTEQANPTATEASTPPSKSASAEPPKRAIATVEGETVAVNAEWTGETLAEILDPASALRALLETHPSLADKDEPFLALAALRLVGFQLGAMQNSITTRIEHPVMERIQLSYIAALVKRYTTSLTGPSDPARLIQRLLPLARKVYEAFMSNRERAQEAGLHPVWFAGKEICLFLTGDPERINPEEIMNHGQFLHDTIVETKKLFDQLLDKGIRFVPSPLQ